MGKLLVLIVLVLAGVWLVKRALRNAARPDEAPPPAAQASEELVRCAHCGLLLPRGEARQAGGAIYCSEEHSRLGSRR